MANAFAVAMAEPAFVSVNIGDVSYDAATRTARATVSGTVSVQLPAEARLNVWLIEDSLLADGGSGVGHGPVQSGTSGTFYHNHVLRANLSGGAWGEAGVVNTETGSDYAKTYNVTIPSYCDATKCYLVAFVGNEFTTSLKNCMVFNATKTNYLYDGTPDPDPDPDPDGIEDIAATSVRLYPNPTTGTLFIEVEGLQKVEVVDAVGRVVMTQSDANSINMGSLANGVYTVRVTAGGNTVVKKIVKR